MVGRRKKKRSSPKECHDTVRKGSSRCYGCVVYIMEETLCSAIRKIMSSHVNGRCVCSVEMSGLWSSKYFCWLRSCPCVCGKPRENRDTSRCSIEQTALFIPFFCFSLISSSFLPPFGSLDPFPSLLCCLGLLQAPWRPEDEWLFLTREDGRD